MQIAEFLPAEPNLLWEWMRQIGVNYAVAPLPRHNVHPDQPWDYAPLERMVRTFENAGFQVAAIESAPPMQKTRLGLPGRDEEIECFCTLVRNMGALHIPVLCYNWMAVFGWTRTHTDLRGRAGALVTGYDHKTFQQQPLTEFGEVPEEQLWQSLRYFLQRVLPVAEKQGVRLAMHPDDPPISPVRGIARIMRSQENFQRLIDMAPSSSNGITLCQGNFALFCPSLPETIRHFGRQRVIHFVHMRDVQGTPENFVEVFHNEGPTDLAECMRAYLDMDFRGPMRPDHVPTLAGDSNENPSYSATARLHAVGYLQGLHDAVYGRSPRHRIEVL
ncbi:MAG: mannonate dehydratase [Chthonomonadales bacterium]